MQQKKRHTRLFYLLAFIGLSTLLLWLSSNYYIRIDLTIEGKYSLSEQTKNLLQNIESSYDAEIYLSGELPYGFQKLQDATCALIEELNIRSKKEITYKIPEIDTQNPAQIQKLTERGLRYTSVNIKDKKGKLSQQILFPSLILHNGKKEVVVPLLKNNPKLSGQENLNQSIAGLEYELINALRMLEQKQQPTVAFLEGHGELAPAQTIDFAKSLTEHYLVKRINTKEIKASLAALIIAQPRKNFSEEDKYAIDQYIMNGGKILWLVDEVEVSKDSLRQKNSAMAFYKPLNIEDQLFTYGIRINPQLCLDYNADLVKINTALKGEQARFTPLPWAYEPLLETNPNHAISKGIAPVRAVFANTIDTIATPTIEKIPLLRTSAATRLENVPRIIRMQEVKMMQEQAFYRNSHATVGMLLEGVFPSVFKDRLYNKRENFKANSLPTKILVIADGDIIKNETRGSGTAMQFLPLGYNSDYKYTHGNKSFLLNTIDYLCDDEGWLALRNKEFSPALLNKSKVRAERTFWQVINLSIPLLLLLILGLFYTIYRRMKFGRN